MKKNGFTLIELLAVLVILGLIALVTISTVTGTLKSYKNSLYQNQLDNIESAARLWSSDNMLKLPDSENTTVICEYANYNNCPDSYYKLILDLSDLQNGGYIDADLKNVKTKKPFKSVKINIVKNGKKIEYEVIVEEYQNS